VLQHQAQRGACAGTACLLLKAGADPTVSTLMTDTDISVTAATLAGINGHFALEALLSRAADDYARTHPGVSSTAAESSSSRLCSSSDTSDSSSSAAGVGAQHCDCAHGAAADNSGSGTTTVNRAVTDVDSSAAAAAAEKTAEKAADSVAT
jgi:hypothetical protein